MRKVEYRLMGLTRHEMRDGGEDLGKTRSGVFHQWGLDVTKDEPPINFSVAIIEEDGTGKVHLVEPGLVKFLP